VVRRGRGARRDRGPEATGLAFGGGLLLAGSLFERFAVYRAGSRSARDPKYTVLPQRKRAVRIGSRATTPN
jgi:hypothetical protein